MSDTETSVHTRTEMLMRAHAKGSRIEILNVKQPNGSVYVLLVKTVPITNKVVILEKQKVNNEPTMLEKRSAHLNLNRN